MIVLPYRIFNRARRGETARWLMSISPFVKNLCVLYIAR